jgi:hypothetical protein
MTANASEAVLRRAVLLIHGIGQQRRYETLAEFTLGLIRYGLPERFKQFAESALRQLWQGFRLVRLEQFQHSSVRLEGGLDIDIQPFKFGDGLDTRVSIKLPSGDPETRGTEVDIYEAYWAPSTGGQTNVIRVLLWLIGTTWVALKNGLLPTDRRPKAKDFLLELFRLALIFALLIGVLAGLFWAIRGLCMSYSGYTGSFWTHYDVPYVILTLIWIYFSLLAAQYVQGMLLRSQKLTILQALIVFSLVVGIAAVIWWRNYHGIRDEVWWFSALILLCVVVRTVLVDYLGDIEVYISGNEIGRNRQARKEILTCAQEKLECILERPAPEEKSNDQDARYYDEVIVVGHSLGSVIAYDLLCRVLHPDAEWEVKQARERVKHLFTIGSPLDKVWYFFRDRSNADNPVYQGILAKLKGTKDAGIPESPLSDLEWTNIWCATDVISGNLTEYGDQVENIHVSSLLWPLFVNHVRYWTSGEAMERLGNRVFVA